MILSLIIPIYNVEKYIIDCLNVLVNQVADCDIEIILINDGTPDNSMFLIEEFLKDKTIGVKNKFIIHNQRNQGLSAARNTGIELAKGEYIAFLDSDDIVSENYFKTLLEKINLHHPDIIEFNANRFDDSGRFYEIWNSVISSGFYQMNENILNKVATQSAWYAWKRIYKKELFKEIKFPVGKNFEDAYTIPYIYLKSNNIYFIDEILLHYRFNPNSITSSITDKNLSDFKGAIMKLSHYIERHPFLINSLLSLSRMYIQMYMQSKGFYNSFLEWRKLKNQIALQKHKDIVRVYVKDTKHLAFYYLGVILASLVLLKNKLV
ncbi:glycosyltransferase family 2 protein [Acinetobacter soli]|uniref:Glycosyltransferase family 2 protein n=2 Tax=Acinetobacter soli TaxID=487316 RepID=A0AB38YY36_9GAMM|nr:glycosyltransferase family 2 protein [Acinetobacter soli]WND06308.1 glycosyltransferase family 2 protein [Acinetobacter soli]